MVYKPSFFNSEVFKTVYMGVSFMVLFSGFYTLSNLQKLFLASTKKEDPSFTGDGYTSLGVLYIVFSCFMWLVPSVISVIGAKATLVIGSLGYSFLTASFLTESATLLYAGSVFCGMGASMIWNSQGNYMVLVSSKVTLTRNLAIFNIIWQSSMFYGNIFASVTFYGKEHIDKDARMTVIFALLGVSIAGTVVMLFLPSPTDEEGKKIEEDLGGPITAIKKTWKLARTKYMLILFPSFLYMGLQICFMSGVYGACVGFTKRLEHSEQLVPVIGLIIGGGEIIAEIIIICLGKTIASKKWGQTCMMVFALVLKYIAFILVFLNFPDASVFGETDDLAIIPTSWTISIVAALIIGITDGTYMSMIPAMVGMLFPENSVIAMALYTFSFSLFTAVGFFASNYISLYWQLLVLTVTGTLGVLSFIYVSLDVHRQDEKNKKSVQQTKM